MSIVPQSVAKNEYSMKSVNLSMATPPPAKYRPQRHFRDYFGYDYDLPAIFDGHND